MKQIILTMMVMLTLATSATGMFLKEKDGYDDMLRNIPGGSGGGIKLVKAAEVSDWDHFFNVTLNPATNGWDEFWGTTMHPTNTGWNDFWYSCQDETKGVGECIGTVVAGAATAALAPLVIIGAAISIIGPTTATFIGAPMGATLIFDATVIGLEVKADV